VFISSGPDGRRVLGLSAIPEGRPLLLVGNHQTLALDLGLIAEQFLRERRLLLRGLAHPVIFEQTFGGGDQGKRGAGEPGGAAGGGGSGGGARDGLPGWDPISTFGAALEGELRLGPPPGQRCM
jgi:uncharacterized membrane protein YgcG